MWPENQATHLFSIELSLTLGHAYMEFSITPPLYPYNIALISNLKVIFTSVVVDWNLLKFAAGRAVAILYVMWYNANVCRACLICKYILASCQWLS